MSERVSVSERFLLGGNKNGIKFWCMWTDNTHEHTLTHEWNNAIVRDGSTDNDDTVDSIAHIEIHLNFFFLLLLTSFKFI